MESGGLGSGRRGGWGCSRGVGLEGLGSGGLRSGGLESGGVELGVGS